jgi:hypothetical protein
MKEGLNVSPRGWIGAWRAWQASAMMVVVALTAFSVNAAVWYAKPVATGAGSGGSWGNAATLQTAMESAVSGDQIWVLQGTYVPSSYNYYDEAIHGNDPRHRHFAPRDGVGIYGGFVGTETELGQRNWRTNLTILDGDLGASGKVYHVLVNWFSVPGASTVLDGLTIANGNADSTGWHACGGGMISVGDNVNPSVRNCTFRDNGAASYGGAFFADAGADATFENCVFRNNVSGNLGGAITLFANCAAVVNGCLFHDNTAAYGGAILLDGASPTLAVANCTFADNVSTDMGGGGIAILGPSTTIVNSIFWGNSPDGVYDRDTTTAVTYSDVQGGFAGTGNLSADPQFADAVSGDYRLQLASSCIDVGSNGGVPAGLTVDLDGTDRILDTLGGGAIVDMGAYEYTTPPETANLTMAANPVGDGTTTPAIGSHVVNVGSPVAITATPTGTQVFVNWTVTAGNATLDDANADSTTVTLTDAAGATVTANFADAPPETATLTMAVAPGGSGTTTPAVGPHTVNVGEAQAITATPAGGFAFANWTVTVGSATITDANSADTTVTVNGVGGATVQANFAEETTLTMAISDALAGAISPAVGAHAVAVGAPVDITATANVGYRFVNWTVTVGNATLGDANSADTTVTLTDNGGATVQANFGEQELIAVGLLFDIGNDEVGLAPTQFNAKPKVYAVYTDPVKLLPGKKATAKVITKVSTKLPVDDVTCEWAKKIRLYNTKLLSAAYKAGTTTAAWLAANPAQNQTLELPLRLSSKQVVDRAVRTVDLSPPTIDTVTVQAATIDVVGDWFGTKKPKGWMVYLVVGKGIKTRNSKLMAPDGRYLDTKGKAVFMDQRTGASKLVILRPIKLPAGVADWDAVTHVVIDNGTGIAAEAIDWNP